MKKIIYGVELQEKMEKAIQLLCGTVKQTLGPKGNNVIIDHSNFSPFITNDGVTIAKNIESDEEGIATILELAKEAAIKTDEVVGDGTTTTLVLLESLFLNGLEYIRQGIHPIVLKQELNQMLVEICHKLFSYKKIPSEAELYNIAISSANDISIGKVVFDAFSLVKDKSAIIVQETNQNEVSFSHYQGYYFSTTLASPLFLENQISLSYQDALILIFQGALNDIERISFILNEVMEQNQNLIIIANHFDDYVVNEILSKVLDGNLHCCIMTLEEYGLNEWIIKKDLEIITGAQIIEENSEISLAHIGHISSIEINSEVTRIVFQKNSNIDEYVAQIQKDLLEKQDDIHKDFYKKRLAMFTNGIAKICIGALTKVECREKRMRLEDAICAISTTLEGILPGGGITLFQISQELNTDTIGSKIWKQTLMQPLEQIIFNAGLDINEILSKIEQEKGSYLYNISKNKYEKCSSTSVIDSYQVVLYSLQHACSIAVMLLTTTSLIINEQDYSTSKNNYSEL